ncbi:MAG TPA: 30S ribosomal protein S13 [bacterium]|nr:30S ribosomal protein S13 [bacterium]
MVVRIAGVTLPNDKRIEVALTYIFGIGLTKSKAVLAKAKISADVRTKDLTEDQANELRVLIEKNERVEGDLRREVASNVKRLKDIGAYRGARHSRNLPCNGQRTKTNSRTVRGNHRQTMGSGRKPTGQKT